MVKEYWKLQRKLLEDNMIDFAGSDTHHERHVESFKTKLQLKSTVPLIKALNNNSLFSS